MVAKVTSGITVGLEVHKIDIEVDVVNSLPQTVIVGMIDTAIKEAKERLRLAIKNSGFSYPQTKVVINLAPADLKKEGTIFDLAMAIGILVREKIIGYEPQYTAFLGELSLDGTIKGVNGVLPIVSELKNLGYTKVIVPFENLKEASFVQDIEVLGAKSLNDIVLHLNEGYELLKSKQNIKDYLNTQIDYPFDFKDIKGQNIPKRALQIAAAGGHNVLMQGPPGSGKTLLAKAFPSILPPLEEQEAMEITKIYSASGLLDKNEPIITKRPFRTPHHSASAIGIIGGGSSIPKPGEITLAHRGVLFLDEMVEFPRSVLEVLRQPLEDREVTISRASQSAKFPANFILIGAINPCPCGYLGDSSHECKCSESQIQRYKSRISGPLLDRIDLQVEVSRLKEDELLGIKEESQSSYEIRQTVIKARQIQLERYKNLDGIFSNAELTSKLINKFCKIDESSKQMLKNAIRQFNLSGRAYDRILKISRTIADLEGSENIQQNHITQALCFRGLE